MHFLAISRVPANFRIAGAWVLRLVWNKDDLEGLAVSFPLDGKVTKVAKGKMRLSVKRFYGDAKRFGLSAGKTSAFGRTG